MQSRFSIQSVGHHVEQSAKCGSEVTKSISILTDVLHIYVLCLFIRVRLHLPFTQIEVHTVSTD